MNNRHILHVKGKRTPVVEIDHSTNALYVYFAPKKTKVAKTLVRSEWPQHIAVDLDEAGEVVGVEAIGMKELTIGRLLSKAGVEAEEANLGATRYVWAGNPVPA